MFNKPRGCITARRDPRHKTVMDYFPEEMRNTHFPVGRLDKDTEGLLIITDDGKLAHELLTPDRQVSKTYLFYTLGLPDSAKLSHLESGAAVFPDKDIVTAPAAVSLKGVSKLCDVREFLSEKDFALALRKPNATVTVGEITITEGKKHEVKRMLLYAGARVVYLKRLSIASLTLDNSLKIGEYRSLTDAEIASLKKNNTNEKTESA